MKDFDEQLEEADISIAPDTPVRLENIENVWEGLAGAKLAKQTRPLALDRQEGRLVVGVGNTIWLEELEKQHERLEEQITAWLPDEIESIYFELDRSIRPGSRDDSEQSSGNKNASGPERCLPEHLEDSLSKLDNETASIVRRIHGKITE